MQPYYESSGVTLHCGDSRAVLAELPRQSVRCCVTSPPYFGLRDYGVDGQIGLEASPAAYVAELVALFAAVREALTDDGTLWLNLGDSYAHDNPSGPQGRSGDRITRTFTAAGAGGIASGLPGKNLLGIPWRVAFALQADGWYLRSDIVWVKPNPMPESVRDRPTRSHEYIFLLSKRASYYYDADAIREPLSDGREYPTWDERKQSGEPTRRADPSSTLYINRGSGMGANLLGRNKRDVWTVTSDPYPEAHFATFPPALITPCILAGSAPGDTVLDPFSGSGTTAMVAKHLGRRAVGIELNPAYCDLAIRRLSQEVMPLEMAV